MRIELFMDFKLSVWNVFVLLIVALLAGLLGYSVRGFLLDPGDGSLLIAVTAASVSLLSAVLTNVYGKIQERKLKIEEDLRKNRTPIYDRIMSFLVATFSAGSTSQEDQLKFWKEITPQITMWGSDELFAQWSNFKYELTKYSTAPGGEAESPERMAHVVEVSREIEKVFLLIRKDLGYDN
jgi:hypothetical protein